MIQFITETANLAIQRTAPSRKEIETVPTAVKRRTLEKLHKSLTELEGRYGENARPYSDTKPSQNWKVAKNVPARANIKKEDGSTEFTETMESYAARVKTEEVFVWFKVGIIKQVIGANGEKQLRMKPQDAKTWIEDMITMVEKFSTDDAHWVEACKLAATPKSAPNQEKHPGMLSWEYNYTTHMFDASPENPRQLKEVV
jgi:hypothetical protein